MKNSEVEILSIFSIKYLNSLFIPLIKRYSFLKSLAYGGILLFDLMKSLKSERCVANTIFPTTDVFAVAARNRGGGAF